MNCRQKLPDSTEEYLCRFYEILNEMIFEMTDAESCDSISYDFIIRMIPHHRAAIEMSGNVLRYKTSETVKKIAENIIREQTESIDKMKCILHSCKKVKNTTAEIRKYRAQVGAVEQNMFRKMRCAYTDGCIENDFMREMIPHHEGGIQMSSVTLKYRICPSLEPILNSIIQSQTKGVREMRARLCRSSAK